MVDYLGLAGKSNNFSFRAGVGGHSLEVLKDKTSRPVFQGTL